MVELDIILRSKFSLTIIEQKWPGTYFLSQSNSLVGYCFTRVLTQHLNTQLYKINSKTINFTRKNVKTAFKPEDISDKMTSVQFN